MKLRIVTIDGHSTVLNALTGEKVEGVKSAIIHADAGGVVAWLEVVGADIDIEVDAPIAISER